MCFKLASGFYFILCDQLIISSYVICNYNSSFGIWERQNSRFLSVNLTLQSEMIRKLLLKHLLFKWQ